ncbi:hypothetical protein JIN85_09620 [Luteolibacter pohnpeiensis]|uniref:Uncharacterized protein n=1 Tax=Luteolibacter pohnpeiensis TaxID=454153 RepID=A0A934S7F1_9BACT|nr:hypothetical protein [Luteolibacter pohnpeiensis]MBK1882675.1 hypothetical protein [Luteolibacter pohnpeiensis]
MFAAEDTHPADSNGDHRIVLSEIETYWNTTLSSMPDAEKKLDPAWQTADHLWRHGEFYTTHANLTAPFCFLPNATAPQANLSNRYARSLSVIEILAPNSPTTSATAEFRPFDGPDWFALDVGFDPSTGKMTMMVPYLPDLWLRDSTRRIEIRATLDGVMHECGDLELQPIDRSNFSFDIFYTQLDTILDDIALSQGVDLDSAMQSLKSGNAISAEANLFAAAKASADYNKAILDGLKNSGSASGQAVREINEELFLLLMSQEDRAETARMADRRNHATSSTMSRAIPMADGYHGCAPIHNRVDLQIESIERCRLDNKKDIIDQIKEATGLDGAIDKVGEKLSEIAEKTSKKFVSNADKGSKVTSGLPIFAIKASYELYNFKEEWNKQQLPYRITKFNYEAVDEIGNPTYLYEDSPQPGNGCETIRLKVFAHAEGRGFDTAKFLIDKIPSASDSLPQKIQDFPFLGKIATDLVNSGQKAVLDTAHAGLKEDLQFTPCRWPEDASAKGIELEFKENYLLETIPGSAIQVDGPESQFFRGANIGKGPLRVKLVVDERRLCLEPYNGLFSYEVKPIRVVFVQPAYTVDDVDHSLTISVDLEDSHEIGELNWYFADKNGNWLTALREEDGTETLNLEDIDGHITTSNTKRHTLTINPPDDLDLYPLTVEANSPAQGCLRPIVGGFRFSQAQIHYQAKAFFIQPNHTCFPLESSQTLTAIPADPTKELDVEWEVTSGNATITKTSATTATLVLGDTPSAEIEVMATGNDTFKSFGYYSSGPCFDSVSLFSQYSEAFHLNPVLGETYTSQISVLSFGDLDAFAESNPQQWLTGLTSGQSAGINYIYGIGATRATIMDHGVADEENGTYFNEVSQDGYFWPILNFNRSGLTDFGYEESAGGTYVTDYLELTADEKFGEAVAAEEMKLNPEGTEVTVTLSYFAPSDFFETGSNVNAFWTVFGGNKVDEYVEDGSYYLVATFPVTEELPTIVLRLTGSVNLGGDIYSVDYSGTTQFRKVQVRGMSTYMYSKDDSVPRLCGNWEGKLNVISEYIREGCCGNIELFGNDEYLGTAHQNIASSVTFLASNPDIVGSIPNFLYSTSDSIPYCLEVKRLKRDHPTPPVPPHRKPDDDPDPEPETPPEIDPDFKNSPVSNPDHPEFPSPDPILATSPGTQAGGIFIANQQVQYPFQEIDFTGANGLYPNGIELGTYQSNTGAYLSRSPFVSAASLAYLADTRYNVVAYGKLSGDFGDGLLLQREFDDVRYIDFWERDASDGKLTGTTLIHDAGSFRALGMGDYDGDGSNDIAGGDDSSFLTNGPLLLHKGSVTGFAATPTIFYSNPTQDVLRAAATIPGTTNSFIGAMDADESTAVLITLDSNGAVISRRSLPDIEGIQIRAFADLNNDTVPDLILHSFLATQFEVHFLNTDGTTQSTRTFTCPSNIILPGYPLF